MAKKTTTTAPAAARDFSAPSAGGQAVAPGSLGAALITLAMVAEATASDTGFLFVPLETSKDWVDNGLAEVNNGLVNEAGAVATRVTEKGIASMTTPDTSGATAGNAAPAAPKVKPTFVIRRIAVQAPIRTASENAGIYPFASLEAPEGEGANAQVAAFFVPATAERPKPWETLASTVSSAQSNYRTETGEEKFKGKEKVLAEDGKTQKIGADGKPEFREVEKTRKTYDYHRVFRTTRGFDEVRDDEGNVVNNEDGTPKKIEGAWVSRVK